MTPLRRATPKRLIHLAWLTLLPVLLLSASLAPVAAQEPVVDLGDDCEWASVERSDYVNGHVSTATVTLRTNMVALHLPSGGRMGTMDDNDGWYLETALPTFNSRSFRDPRNVRDARGSLIEGWANPNRPAGQTFELNSAIEEGKYGPFFLIDYQYYRNGFQSDKNEANFNINWTNLIVGNRQFRTPANADDLGTTVGPQSVVVKRAADYHGAGWLTVTPIEVPYTYFEPNLLDNDRGERRGAGFIPMNHPRQMGEPCRIAMFLNDANGAPPYQTEPEITEPSEKSEQQLQFSSQQSEQQSYIAPAGLVSDIRGYAAETHHGTAHVERWQRVLIGLGVESYAGLTAMTSAEAQTYADRGWKRWDPVVTELGKAEAAATHQEEEEPPPPPELSITGGASVTEGADAVFTISANPAATSPLTVNLSASQSGDFASSLPSTVTLTGGSATLRIGTVDDSADEPDGSITVALTGGGGYTVGSGSSATVAISDNDDPAPPPNNQDPASKADLISRVTALVDEYEARRGESSNHFLVSWRARETLHALQGESSMANNPALAPYHFRAAIASAWAVGDTAAAALFAEARDFLGVREL